MCCAFKKKVQWNEMLANKVFTPKEERLSSMYSHRSLQHSMLHKKMLPGSDPRPAWGTAAHSFKLPYFYVNCPAAKQEEKKKLAAFHIELRMPWSFRCRLFKQTNLKQLVHLTFLSLFCLYFRVQNGVRWVHYDNESDSWYENFKKYIHVQ